MQTIYLVAGRAKSSLTDSDICFLICVEKFRDAVGVWKQLWRKTRKIFQSRPQGLLKVQLIEISGSVAVVEKSYSITEIKVQYKLSR